MILAVLILSVVALVLSSDGVQADCTEAGIWSCLGLAFQTIDPSTIDSDCMNVSNIKTCVINLPCQTNDPVYIRNAQGVFDAVTHICKNGKVLAKNENHECVQNASDSPQRELCNDAYGELPVNASNQQTCEAANKYFKCLRTLFTGNCGAEVGRVFSTYLEKRAAPEYLLDYHCTLGGVSHGASFTMLTVALLAAAILDYF